MTDRHQHAPFVIPSAHAGPARNSYTLLNAGPGAQISELVVVQFTLFKVERTRCATKYVLFSLTLGMGPRARSAMVPTAYRQ